MFASPRKWETSDIQGETSVKDRDLHTVENQGVAYSGTSSHRARSLYDGCVTKTRARSKRRRVGATFRRTYGHVKSESERNRICAQRAPGCSVMSASLFMCRASKRTPARNLVHYRLYKMTWLAERAGGRL